MVYSRIKSKNRSIINELMPSKLTISVGESNLLSPIINISFWEKGEMEYSALRKINELKANNELDKAKILLSEWIF